MKNLLLLLAIATSSLTTLAQNEIKKWVFGQNAGLDFTSGTATPMFGSAMVTDDNSAAISDANGNLLFYTNGVTVWNRLNNVMSNGTGLLGNQSGGQPATIVPHPGNPNLFYVFTVDIYAFPNGLRYSIIDMSMQSGLGAVTATKNVLIYTPATEKVISVKHCNGRDYWLLTHNWNSNEFKVYLIDNNGFNTTPVSSFIGTVHSGGNLGYYNASGQITVSMDGSRIGLSIYDMGVVEFFNFNNQTGSVTNSVSISGFTNAWGVEFSPSGNVAYITRWQGSALWQVNLLAGNAAAIQSSSVLISAPTSPHATYKSGYLKRGPDGKIYVAKYNSPFVGVIDAPETLGLGCNYIDSGVNLGGPLCRVGFDNSTYQDPPPTPQIVSSGTCQYYFSLSDTTNIAEVLWNFNDPASNSADTSTSYNPSHVFTTSGVFNVQCIIDYACYQDTIYLAVNASSNVNSLFNAPIVNCSTTISFINSSNGATYYNWDFGDSSVSSIINPVHTYADTGVYSVVLIAGNSCSADTFSTTITIAPEPIVSISGVDTICPGQSITLTASGAITYQWSGGSTATTSSIFVSPIATTAYYLIGSNLQCPSIADTFEVFVRPAEIALISGISPICSGQSVTLSATGGSSYQWSGGSSSTSSTITVSPATTTTYYVMPGNGNCPGVPDTFTVVVIPNPIVNAGGNTQICAGQSTTLFASGGTNYQWSGGSSDTTATITVSPLITTTYFVTASNGNCTSGFDTITVVVLPSPTVSIVGPNAVCMGSSVTLTAVGTATTYVWGGSASGTGSTVTDTPGSASNYWVIGYNSLGCSDTAITTVGLYDPQSPAIIADDTICFGESLQLFCAGTGTYTWSPASSLNNAQIQSPTASPSITTTYSVQITDANGCIGNDTHTVYVEMCTGINSIPDQITSLEVYPNPSSGSVNIESSDFLVNKVQVYSASGALVMESIPVTPTSIFKLDMNILEDGIYFFRISSDSETYTQKVILKH